MALIEVLDCLARSGGVLAMLTEEVEDPEASRLVIEGG
jgi:hypothetical protein